MPTCRAKLEGGDIELRAILIRETAMHPGFECCVREILAQKGLMQPKPYSHDLASKRASQLPLFSSPLTASCARFHSTSC